ncbi:MAG: hypothetical protein MUC97_10605 [Bernardetiaceae bacterium]|jgi:hypothetical protein|nr:hypothetical protein [Bernardetiaceae bacterium]
MAAPSVSWQWLLAPVRGIRQWDWRAIVACVVLAVFVWVFNALNKTHEYAIDYPLQFSVNAKRAVVPIQAPPMSLRVRVSGSGWSLLRRFVGWDLRPLEVRINQPVGQRFWLPRSNKVLLDSQLNDLTVLGFVPDTVWFRYDWLKTRTFKVVARPAELASENGYLPTGPVMVAPPRVELSGPAALLDSLPAWLAVDFGGHTLSANFFSEDLPLQIPYPDLLTPHVDKVKVRLDAQPFRQGETLVPVVAQGFPADSSVTLQQGQARLRYLAPASAEPAPPQAFKVWAEFRYLERGAASLPPCVELPPGYRFLSLEPAQLPVKYAENWNNRRDRSR